MSRSRLAKNPVKTVKIERTYARQLTKVARHVGDIVSAFDAGDPAAEPFIRHALTAYSQVIEGWAARTAGKMLAAVDIQDEAAWMARAREMTLWLRREIRTAPTGALMQQRLAEQVALIKSIPLDAAQRVHDLTIEGQENATRSKGIAAEIQSTTGVSTSKAKLIARTEVARTASLLTQARAIHVGATHAVWRTSGDSDVRESHREMNGKVFSLLEEPPLLSDGTRCFPGQIYNCRCFMDPIIPD